MTLRLSFLLAVLILLSPALSCRVLRAADPAVNVTADLSYKTGGSDSDYENKSCRLDLYAPADAKNLPCLVWLHGGGLTGGSKADAGVAALCRALAGDGMLVANVEYRLSPKVKYPAYIEDSAAAVAWVKQHAVEHGGDPARIFVGGHSAGGYLTGMLALDAHYLRAVGIDAAELAGFIPVSGQMMTHYTVRKERGLPETTIVADEAAPIYHVRRDTPPWLILYADHDAPLRAEENRYFTAALQQTGNPGVTSHEITGRDHGTIAEWIAHPHDPAREQIVAFVHRVASGHAREATSASPGMVHP